MGVLDYLKTVAMKLGKPKATKKYGYETYNSPSMNDEKQINQPINQPNQFNRDKSKINILNPAKDAGRDISRDKTGQYIPTITYPLPPLSWEKKQLEINKRMRNSKNKYL